MARPSQSRRRLDPASVERVELNAASAASERLSQRIGEVLALDAVLPEHHWGASSQALVVQSLQSLSPPAEPADEPARHADDPEAAVASWDRSHVVVENGRVLGQRYDDLVQFWRLLRLPEARVHRVLVAGHVKRPYGVFLKDHVLGERINVLASTLQSVDAALAAVRACPDILRYSSETHVRVIVALQVHLGPDRAVAVVARHPRVLMASWSNTRAVLTLLSNAMGGDRAAEAIARTPTLLQCQVYAMRQTMIVLVTAVGHAVVRDVLLAGCAAVLRRSAAHVRSVIRTLRLLLPDVELADLLRACPRLLLCDSIAEKVDVLRAVWRLSHKAQAQFLTQMKRPATAGRILTASLEVLRRIEYVAFLYQQDPTLKELSVATMVIKTKLFNERFPGYELWRSGVGQPALLVD